MAGVIFELVDRYMSGPIVWGESDCLTSCCNVFRDLSGVDPLWPYRGSFNTRQGLLRHISDKGGWFGFANQLAIWSNLESGRNEPGDIGVTFTGIVSDEFRRAVTIYGGSDVGWFVRTSTGFGVVKYDLISESWTWRR